MEREVYIKPPKEAKTNCIWRMLRCPYGLVDAGRSWYLRLTNELITKGMLKSKYDQAVFTWFKQDKLSGLLLCHVDDIMFGGSQQFHTKVIAELKRIFVIGVEENTNLKYLGLNIYQNTTGVHLSTKKYGESLSKLPTTLAAENKEQFSADQTRTLKQFCGKINWLTTQGRPDIAFDSCFISNSLKTGNCKVFAAANKVIRKVHCQNVTLHFYHDFDISSFSIVSFCDASFANLPNGGSQGGYLSLLIDKNGLYVPITWQSRKVRRVVKSTIAAECLAAVEAAEMTLFLAAFIKDLFQATDIVKTHVYCDNKNLVNSVYSSTNVEDKRLLIDISVLRDLVQRKELTEFSWVDTKLQLADVLTKKGASDKLLLSVFNNKLHFDFNSAMFE
jgi:hypothetical protein